MTYLNGSSAGEVEGQLRERGFSFVSTNRNQGFIYSHWWDEGDDKCIVVEARNSQVMTTNDAPDQDCGHHKGSDAAAAVGVVAGMAILGAQLGHKSNHHEDKQHYASVEDEAHFDRGYNDGLHNVAYHNYDRSSSYSSGYQAGVQQREANTSYHHGRGGYHPAARSDDLQGARAAGGMDEMSLRGFAQVDNFTSGNTRYSIQYKSDTRQCVQVTIADGHFYDLRDIGRHPNCR